MTVIRDPRRLALIVALVVIAAAAAFGLWHVVVGGLLNGNPRAGTFGAVLTIAAGSVLAAATIVVRRRSSARSRAPGMSAGKDGELAG